MLDIANNLTSWKLTGRLLFLEGATGGGSGGASSVGSNGTTSNGSAATPVDAYRQSSSASPRGVVSGSANATGYCGSSASTPHSHSTSGSYSVANHYGGSPTLYTSRKFAVFFFF